MKNLITATLLIGCAVALTAGVNDTNVTLENIVWSPMDLPVVTDAPGHYSIQRCTVTTRLQGSVYSYNVLVAQDTSNRRFIVGDTIDGLFSDATTLWSIAIKGHFIIPAASTNRLEAALESDKAVNGALAKNAANQINNETPGTMYDLGRLVDLSNFVRPRDARPYSKVARILNI
jgi:hypothetical protein